MSLFPCFEGGEKAKSQASSAAACVVSTRVLCSGTIASAQADDSPDYSEMLRWEISSMLKDSFM